MFAFYSDHLNFGRDIANSIFDLETQGQVHGQGLTRWSHWDADFNQYVCFSFCCKGPLLAETLQIPYLTLKIQGRDHDKNRPKSNQVMYRSGSSTMPTMKENLKVVWKLSCKNLRSLSAAAADVTAFESVKHNVTPVYRDDLIRASVQGAVSQRQNATCHRNLWTTERGCPL